MNGKPLSTETIQKDLGVYISNTCTPSFHCAKSAKKANQVLGQINRAFSCRTKDVMLQIYKVFVRPHLEYAVSAWSPWLQKDIKVMEQVQHRATRQICNIRGSYEERLQQLQLTTLEDRRMRGDAIEIYKYLHHKWDVDFSNIFSISPQNRVTRLQQSYMPLIVPFSRIDLRKNYFAVRGPIIWNNLPDHVRRSNSVNSFKNNYDSYVLSTR